MSLIIDTADHVHHAKSGEDLLVAAVKDGYLYYCGWPPGRVALAECSLIKKASDEERKKLLVSMSAIYEDDFRRRYARKRLALIEDKP